MARCERCGKEIDLPFACTYCGKSYCGEHRLPENHQCSNLPKSPLFWYQKKIRSDERDLLDAMHDYEFCPKCHSYDLAVLSFDEQKVNWQCRICGHRYDTKREEDDRRSNKNPDMGNKGDFHSIKQGVSSQLPEDNEPSTIPREKKTRNRTSTAAVLILSLLIITFGFAYYSGWFNKLNLSDLLPSPTPTSTTKDISIKQVLNELNIARKAVSLSNVSLLTSPRVASLRADDMLNKTYFCHYDLNGLNPDYHYTKLGGRFSVEENIGFLYSSSLRTTDVPEYSRQSLHDMIYNDQSSDWGHRDSLLDPTNNYVDIGISWDDHRLYVVVHMVRAWLDWVSPPRFQENQFLCSGALRLQGSSLQSVMVYYSDPAKHVPVNYDSSLHVTTGETSYSIGDPVAGVVPEPYFYQTISTIRPRMWSISGKSFDVSFDLNLLAGSGLYTIVLYAKNTLTQKHPYLPDRYAEELPVLEFSIRLP